MSISDMKAQELVEMFVAGQVAAIKTGASTVRLLGKTAANTFPFKKELFPIEVFSDICAFVEKESFEIMAGTTEEEREAYFKGDGGTFKSELAEKLRPIFLKKVAELIFNEGTMELNPFFKNLFAQANKKRVAEGKAPLLLTEELKRDLFENYCLLCGNAVLKELQGSVEKVTTNENPLGGMLLMTVITGITGNQENIKQSSQDFFASLEANEQDLGSLPQKKLNKTEGECLKEYVQARELFATMLEYYITLLAKLNVDAKERLQKDNPIYIKGMELLKDIDKTAKQIDNEGMKHLGTILEQVTYNLEAETRKLEEAVCGIPYEKQSSAVLKSPSVAMSERIREKKFDRAIIELRSGEHDKVVFSATRFLEVVANAIVNGVLLAVTAIANTAPSLLSSVPPAAAPSVALSPRPSPATQQKEKMSGSLGLFFTELSRQRLVASPNVDMLDRSVPKEKASKDKEEEVVTRNSADKGIEDLQGKGDLQRKDERITDIPSPPLITVGGPRF